MEPEMTAFSNLIPPFSLLNRSAVYFWKSNARFTLALILKMVIKLARFAAFLLPFKALMFAVTGKNLHIAGHELTGFHVAGIILLLATFMFALFLLGSRSYVNLIRDVFHFEDDLESAGEESTHSIKPDSDAHTMYGTASGFFSSIVLVIILLTSIIFVIPQSFSIIFLYISYAYYVAIHMNASRIDPNFDIQNTRTVFTFCSMVITLIFIGALIAMGVQIGPIAALFVFIASRQLTGSVTEIVGTLHQNRHAIAPRFLRAKLNDLDTSNLQVAVRVAPFLTTAQQQAWISNAVEQLQNSRPQGVEAKWRKLGVRGVTRFDLVIATDDRKSNELLALYDRGAAPAYKQQVAFQRSFPNHPLLLESRATGMIDGYGAVLFPMHGMSDLDNTYIRENFPELAAGLWSTPIPDKSSLITHSGDHLNWINADNLDTLMSVASTPEELDAIRWFEGEFKALKAKCSASPQAILVPGLNSETVVLGADGRMKIAHWSAVDVQPIGCQLGQLLPAWRAFDLEAVLSHVRRNRPDCDTVTVADLELSADLYRLGKCLQRADYSEATSVILSLHGALSNTPGSA